MSITYDQALAHLGALTANGRVATQQELRNLASQVSVTGSGSLTVLYGGDLSSGDHSGAVVRAMAASDSNIRAISKTEAAYFLNDDLFKSAIEKSFGLAEGSTDIRGTAANLFLEGTDGLWGDTSVRFIEETTGDVRILTESPDKTRILYARELPTLLSRLRDTANITSIDGVSRDDLLKIGASYGSGWTDAMRNSLLRKH